MGTKQKIPVLVMNSESSVMARVRLPKTRVDRLAVQDETTKA